MRLKHTRGKAMLELTMEEAKRFWEKTERQPNGCLLWMGYLNRGYGNFKFRGQTWRTHVLAFSLVHDDLPAVIHHTCRDKACVELSHLDGMSKSAHMSEHKSRFCSAGHEIVGKNCYRVTSTGALICRICRNMKQRTRYNYNAKIKARATRPAAVAADNGHGPSEEGPALEPASREPGGV